MTQLTLHPDRLFPAESATRAIARRLYDGIKDLPIISPHGHTDPSWFDLNEPFADPARLLIVPDHYVFRMLYSQGVPLESLGVLRVDDGATEQDGRTIWRQLAENYHLFRGTPSRAWLDWVFAEMFGMTEILSAANADHYYDTLDAALKTDAYRPRALFDRFNIEAIATTEGPLDPLDHHRAIRKSDWNGRVITTYRPDPAVDPEYEGFGETVDQLGAVTGEDVATWAGYLNAHRNRRQYFREVGGATATDHGHITARTADLSRADAERLYDKVRSGDVTAEEADLFRGQMLTEMARMSLDDGMTLQIHPGAYRNHNDSVMRTFGRDKGADIPSQTDYVHALQPLLGRYGSEKDLTIIVFTLDEDSYSRELAPLAGHYPALRLGPPWWFHDSPEGMRRFRERVTETAGFYNTVGFNDDTRAFFSIPARHDVARRMDCAFLARLVAEHRLPEDEAHDVAHALTYDLVKKAYNL